MKLFVLLHLGLTVLTLTVAQEDEVCGGKPADVVFLLDSSASIDLPDFYKQVRFTQDVVSIFDVGSDRTRVGVVLFSDSVHPIIDLAKYTAKTSLLSAIGHLQYIGGGTNTGEALTYVVDKMYNMDEREGVPKVTIVLTDGQSQDKTTTIKEARRAHAAGISIFVIGIGGNTDESELRAIASQPEDEFLFEIENYSALEHIKHVLAIKACEVEYVEPQQEQMDYAGPGGCSLKVIFGADTSGMTTGKSLQISEFFSDVTESISTFIGHLRTSQIISDCPASGGNGNKSYAPLIRKMRLQVMNGQTAFKSVGVLLVDTPISDLTAASREVMRSKFQNFKLLIIAVNHINLLQLSRLFRIPIGSHGFKDHVFQIDSTDNLQAFSTQIANLLNRQCFE